MHLYKPTYIESVEKESKRHFNVDFCECSDRGVKEQTWPYRF